MGRLVYSNLRRTDPDEDIKWGVPSDDTAHAECIYCVGLFADNHKVTNGFKAACELSEHIHAVLTVKLRNLCVFHVILKEDKISHSRLIIPYK
jgi:hypothetical protein